MNDVIVNYNAISRAAYLGLGAGMDDRVRILEMMASGAAKVRHNYGNYRYGSFVLRIEDNKIEDVFLDSMDAGWCEECYGAEYLVVSAGCDHCDSDGCEACADTGELSTSVPCPECNGATSCT